MYVEEYLTDDDVTIWLAAYEAHELEGMIGQDNSLRRRAEEAVGGPFAAMLVQVKCPHEEIANAQGYVSVGVLFMAADKIIESAQKIFRGEKPEGVFYEAAFDESDDPDVIVARRFLATLIEKHDARPLSL